MEYFSNTIDPSLELLGYPHDLTNFLTDSGASQHMTPCL